MKKILLLLPLIISCLKASQLSYATCRSFLDEIKAGAPYENQEAATFTAATIAIAAEKIAHDPFAATHIRKAASQKADCANFLTMAGMYYTYQKEFDTFHNQFIEAQKNNASLKKQDFIAACYHDQRKILSIRAQERAKSLMASPEEQAMGTIWLPVFKEYEKALATAQAVGKESAEKYLHSNDKK